MRALLDDAALVHDQDTVGLEDGCQPMGDDDRRAALHQPVECRLHQCFAFGVERGRGFVEQQDRRIASGSRGQWRCAGAGRRTA